MLKQYKEAIENSNIVSRTDIRGIITFVNDEFCNISGYSHDELIGVDHNIIRHPDVPDSNFKLLWDTILAKKTFKSTVKNLAKNGSTFYLNTTITPILDGNAEIEEFVAIRYDVTQEVELQLALEEKEKELIRLNQTLEERVKEQTLELSILNKHLEKRVQEEVNKNVVKQKVLLSQSRFASLGQMIANIAHQWRQPLTELNLSLFALKNSVDTKDHNNTEQYYQDAKKTIQSMSQTIEDFQNFFNPNKPIEPFNPVKSLNDAIALIKKDLIKNKIILRTSLGTNIQVIGISNELTQVLVNLIQNAKDSLLESRTESKEIFACVAREEEYVKISIQDNGKGIDKDRLEKIFDPYFSTKHASHGTGLGLFMSRMIVEQSLKGSIVASNGDDGALLTIVIPIAHKQ
ncbi:MAG: PAS domain S-box protein [Sulfurovum sp.]|nr:PAS domain S-box protein [Sulfurovum sp.]